MRRHSSSAGSRQAQRANPPEKKKRFSYAELRLVRKDMGAIWAQKGMRALLMLLPLTLAVAVPAVYFVAISLLPIERGARLPEALLEILPAYAGDLDYRQGWLVAFTELLCPLLLLCVPILTAAVSASCSFVAERETGTLETLLLTSLDVKAVFNAKVTGCTILSVLLSAASFILFSITVIIADVFAGVPLFFSFDWLALAVLLMPVLSLFSVVFVGLIVNRVHSAGESLQTMGYLILPVAGVYLVQFTGVIRVNFLALVAIAVVVAAVDVVAFNAASRGFTAEGLLTREGEG